MKYFSVRAKLLEGGEIKFRLYDWDTEGYFTEEMTEEELRAYLVKYVELLIHKATLSGEAYFLEETGQSAPEEVNTLTDPWE